MVGVIYHKILKVIDEKNFCGKVSYLAQQRLWFLFTTSNKKPKYKHPYDI